MRAAPKGYDITALISEAWLLVKQGDRNGLGHRFLKQNGIIVSSD